MNSSAKLNDASILRKFELSQKEATLKSKLFTNKSAQKSKSAQKTTKEIPNATKNTNIENNDPNIPGKRSFTQIAISSDQLKDYEIDKFLSSMESEFHELSKKQVTMGMLNSQQHILKQHTELLNSNQQVITQILATKMNESENIKSKPSSKPIESQRELLKELIEPINAQIAEIRQLYEQTREKAETAAREVALSKSHHPINEQEAVNLFLKMKEYQSSSADLKEKAYGAQARLNNLLPENLLAIKQISNLNIQAYTDCISSLKNQLDTLQKDADKAEKELELRYKKLYNLPKPPLKLKTNDPLHHIVEYGHEGSAEIVKSLQHIDFDVSRKAVQVKLGGDFDYENFIDDVSSIVNEIKDIRSTLESELQPYTIIIPSNIGLDDEDKQRMTQLPSVIDELKVRYKIPNSFKALPQFHLQSKKTQFQPQEPQIEDYSPVADVKFKRLHQKPEALLNIKTTPIEPPPDIKFTKIEAKQKAPERITYSETIFSNPPKSNRDRETRRSLSVQSAQSFQNDTLEQFATIHENFEINNAVSNRPVHHTGLRINTQSETQSQYTSPQKTAPNQHNQYRVRFSEINSDDETFRVKASLPKSEEKLPRAQTEKHSNLLNKEILTGIKEEIIRINQRVDQEESQSRYLDDLQQPFYSKMPYEKHQLPKEQPILLGNQYSDVHIEETTSPRDFPRKLGVQPEKFPDIEAQKIFGEIATPVFSQKLKQSMAEQRQIDEDKKNELFRPVESVNFNKLIQEKQQKDSQLRTENPKTTSENKDLTNMLTENMLNLFTNAIQQINSSLVNSLPGLQERKETPKGSSILELFGARKEPIDHFNESKIKDKASPEEVRVEGFKSEFAPTNTDKLELEAKLTREEIEIMKYYNPFSGERQQAESKPRDQRSSVPNHGQYYFYENSPKPIADYSEFCKDLESEASSMGNHMLKSVSLSYNQSREGRASLSNNKLHSLSNEISFI